MHPYNLIYDLVNDETLYRMCLIRPRPVEEQTEEGGGAAVRPTIPPFVAFVHYIFIVFVFR